MAYSFSTTIRINFPNFSQHQIFSTMKSKNPTSKFSCKAKLDNINKNNDTNTNHNDQEIPQAKKFERRNFLFLGLYSAGIQSISQANPSNASSLSPDFVNCMDASKPDNSSINCCPSSTTTAEIADFVPSSATTIRIRKAAHSSSLDKFEKSIELMKGLPDTDPRSFKQQANVHCAYCNGAYNLEGYSDSLFEIHQSWLFFPFHRWYVYFFERICMKLLEDETFSVPFWNWDSPLGMEIPSVFNVSSSSLYDELRDQGHLPPTVVDLDWNGYDETDISTEDMVRYNLNTIYKQMVTNGKTTKLFMGQPLPAGDDLTTGYGGGSIEIAPHNTVHTWVGDTRQSYREDMGVFYSAARDPIFYIHHANIDRLWNIWQNELGGKNFDDADWLESSFVFYNEEAKPVRVKIKDCLDIKRLGYDYEKVEIPWLDSKPSARTKGASLSMAPEVARVLPKTLDTILKLTVKRPDRGKEKEGGEVLVIEGEHGERGFVKYDVYINEDDVTLCSRENVEFLGSFAHVPHGRKTMGKSSHRFAISDVLEELGANESDFVGVTLVPKSGVVKITRIYIESDDDSRKCTPT